MSLSTQLSSNKEVASVDSGEKLDHKDSRGKPEHEGSLGETAPCKAIDIRARCDDLRRLSEDELLSGMEMAHGTERAAQLEVLLYLIEFDRRRFYLARGYGSLFDFCMDTYRYSRSAAWRRISAARCLARFPRIGEMLLAGELTLSVISMVSGMITPDNAGDVLDRVRGASFRDAELLVARHRPEKIIRDRVKPVFVMNPEPARGGAVSESVPPVARTSASDTVPAGNRHSSSDVGTGCTVHRTFTPDVGSEKFPSGTDKPAGAARPERVVVTKKFKIEFAVEPEFMQDLERARSFLSTKHQKKLGFETLFGILLKEYLDRHSPESRIKKRIQRCENKKKRDIEKKKSTLDKKPAGGDNGAECGDHGEVGKKTSKRWSAQRGGVITGHTGRIRHIPKSIRDEVFVRDGGRCTFISKNGKRCEETCNLEMDHIIPYAKGGDTSPENLRLLCAKHNRLEAEREYGKDHMEQYYRRE